MRKLNKNDIFTALILYITWIILTGDLSISALILGLGVSVLVMLMINSTFTKIFSKKIISRFFLFVYYIVFLIIEVFISSYRVAYFVLLSGSAHNSAIVKVPTKLGQKNRLIKLTFLANMVTLTPGTVTIDVDNETRDLYIHQLNFKVGDTEEIREDIFGKFEGIIRRMFE